MKKYLSLAAFAICTFCAFTFVSCGEDDETPTPKTDDYSTDLVGTWEQTGEQVKTIFTFTKEQITLSYYDLKDGSWVLSDEGSSTYPYTLKDGFLSYYKKENDTITRKAKLLKDKSVLVLLPKKESEGDYITNFMFKKDTNIPVSLDEIQGEWRWYMDGDIKNTRAAVIINRNKLSMIIVAWGQRYDGTITYQNGYIDFEITDAYTSREEGSGEGWGEGELNPETLEANWKTLDSGSWMFFHTQGMPFVADGDVAYGILANLPGIYHKIK